MADYTYQKFATVGNIRIPKSEAYTYQEHWLNGSSVGEETFNAKVIPQGVFERGFSIGFMNEARKQFGYFTSQAVATDLGLEGLAVLTMAPLNPETGESLEDPQVVGRIDKINFEGSTPIQEIPGLTEKLYRILREKESDEPFPFRETARAVETEASGKVEAE